MRTLICLLAILVSITAAHGEAIGPGMSDNTDMAGSDITSFLMSAPEPGACQLACNNNRACRAWTYVRPGVQAAQAVCYLKGTTPAATAHNCCISGVKGTGVVRDHRTPPPVVRDHRTPPVVRDHRSPPQGEPALTGNARSLQRCADAIHTRRKAVVGIGRDTFDCHNGIVVSVDPTARGMGAFNPNHAYFEGNFAHVNAVLANDVVRFYITVENWADPQNCKIAEPLVRVHRRSRLLKVASYIPNWKDWKSIPRTLDGDWEVTAAWLSAAAIAKWHESNEFSRCRRDW